jgi:hypothetical protein
MTTTVRFIRGWLCVMYCCTCLVVGCSGDHSQPGHSANTATPGTTGTVEAPPDSESAEAAAAVLRDYFRAIDERQHARAYHLWEGSGAASGQTLDQFRLGFDKTAVVQAEVGPPGRIEGAAGSRYVEIPVTVRAVTTSGVTQCFRGTYVLRRSVVPGATEEQRHWRIDTAKVGSRPPADCIDSPTAADSVQRQS